MIESILIEGDLLLIVGNKSRIVAVVAIPLGVTTKRILLDFTRRSSKRWYE